MNQPRATLAAGMEVTPSVRLLSPIGAGGMGAVWLADHTALNTRVVVKFMLSGLDSSTSARARFKREAEAASQVKSPHVVQTFDYGVTAEGVPFIVMEFLEGRDLAQEILAKGALEPARVITIVAQVAKALAKAHAANLLHRDIKPDNIFLCSQEADEELFVKLLDFGIAKSPNADGDEVTLDGQTKTGQVVGTPFYMSPEQVTAQKVIDLRSDLWSLGVVAFEALTAKRPFDGPSFGALAVKIATTDAPKPSSLNPDLPPSVDEWFARACARDPAKRFGSARELAAAFRAAFEGVVSLPPLPSVMSDSGASSGSRPRVPSDADARPSFVLASTALVGDGATDRSALARSEPGGAAVAIRGEAAKTDRAQRPPRRLVPIAAAAVVLVAVSIGIGMGVTDGKRVAEGAESASVNAAPPEAPPKDSPPPPPASGASTTPSVASVVASVVEDAAVPFVPNVPVMAATLARPKASAVASAKPLDAGRIESRDAGRHGDILF